MHSASVQVCNLNLRLGLYAVGLGLRFGDADDLVGLKDSTDRVRDFFDQNGGRFREVTKLREGIFVSHDDKTERPASAGTRPALESR
jgi:hypothetical protein